MILHCGYDDYELQAITASSKSRDIDRRVLPIPAIYWSRQRDWC